MSTSLWKRCPEMKIRVDVSRCTGHAQCAAQAPGIFLLDDYGNCSADGREVKPDEVDAAQAGALSCPERAIEIIEDE
jgi:ferredoxin